MYGKVGLANSFFGDQSKSQGTRICINLSSTSFLSWGVRVHGDCALEALVCRPREVSAANIFSVLSLPVNRPKNFFITTCTFKWNLNTNLKISKLIYYDLKDITSCNGYDGLHSAVSLLFGRFAVIIPASVSPASQFCSSTCLAI